MTPLRMLVTRPEAESETLAETLRALGHVPLVAPVMSIVPLPIALPRERFDAVLATSRHATDLLAPATRDAIAALPVYAVGAATAAAARRSGFVDVRVGAGDGARVLDLLRLTLPAGAHLLHLAGRVRKADLPAGLAAAGYRVTVVEAYDASPEEDWAGSVERAAGPDGFDACLHFSRRSAELALAGSRDTPIETRFDAALHACLSEDVAAPLRAAPLTRIAVAAEPTVASVLQGLSDTLRHGT